MIRLAEAYQLADKAQKGFAATDLSGALGRSRTAIESEIVSNLSAQQEALKQRLSSFGDTLRSGPFTIQQGMAARFGIPRKIIADLPVTDEQAASLTGAIGAFLDHKTVDNAKAVADALNKINAEASKISPEVAKLAQQVGDDFDAIAQDQRAIDALKELRRQIQDTGTVAAQFASDEERLLQRKLSLVGADPAKAAGEIAALQKRLELQKQQQGALTAEQEAEVERARRLAEGNVLLEQQTGLVRQVRQAEDDGELLQRRLELIGASKVERDVELARLQQRQELERQGIPLDDARARKLVEQAGTLARQNDLVEYQVKLAEKLAGGQDSLTILQRQFSLLGADPVVSAGVIAREQQRLEIVREIGSADDQRSRDLIDQAGRIAEQNARLTIQKGLVEDIRAANDNLRVLEAERDLVGATSIERETILAQLRTELDLKKRGVDLSSAEAQQLIALNREIAAKGVLLDQQKQFVDSLSDSIRQAWEDGTGDVDLGNITDALTKAFKSAWYSAIIDAPLRQLAGAASKPLTEAIGGTGTGGLGNLSLTKIGDWLGLTGHSSAANDLSAFGGAGPTIAGTGVGQSAALAASGPLGGAGTLPGTVTGSSGGATAAATAAQATPGAASGLSFGQAFGAAGFGLGAFQGFQSGNYAQGVSNLVAAGLMFTPAAPIAPLVPIAGSIIGGFFGNHHPTVGPNSAATGTLYGGLAGITDAGADNDGHVANSVNFLKQLAQALDQVGTAAGKALPPVDANVKINEKSGEILVTIADETRRYTDATEAQLDSLKRLTERYGDLDGDMAKVVAGAGSLDDALQGLQTIATIDALPTYFKAQTDLERQVTELTDRYQALTDQAEKLGLSEQRLQHIREAEAAQLEQLRTDFEASIQRQILEITNSGSASLASLQDAFVQTLHDAAAVGADLEAVERLYGLKRLQAVQSFSEQQLRALQYGTQLDQALAAYETARRRIQTAVQDMVSPLQQFIDAAEQFRDSLGRIFDSLLTNKELSPLADQERRDEALKVLKQTIADAAGGDVTALGNVQADVQSFLQASKDVNASTPAYQADFKLAQDLANGLGVELEPQIDVAHQQLDVLQQILDQLQNPQVDTGALSSLLAAAGLNPALAGGLVSSLASAQQAIERETAHSNRDALQQTYSDLLQKLRHGSPTQADADAWSRVAGELDASGGLDHAGIAKDAGDWEQRGFKVSGYAEGGDHPGGLRIVGERGAELENTGPARYFSAQQTSQIFAAGISQAAAADADIKALTKAVDRNTAQMVVLIDEVRGRGEDARRQASDLESATRLTGREMKAAAKAAGGSQ
ncbi:hypothetical protein [Tistlia consotensis]|uniref:Prophage tail length tape measure protein n=1 Tax=Tistlia consotensis USBA 355 TaxID=560819 RepID=A0A1Y6BQ66_9PROT|nr:hypothetical protein [Tistlia consotensis]SMF23381.1 hypothetical protein SAMN05428998_1082 [Tistlia consotensis USBA 355]